MKKTTETTMPPLVSPLKATRLTQDEANANAAGLLAYLRVGRDSHQELPPERLKYGRSVGQLKAELKRIRAVAAREKLALKLDNIDSLYKLRQVAIEYSDDQMEALAAQVRRHRSRFSISHLIRLLPIAPEDPAHPTRHDKRDRITGEAIRQSWKLNSVVAAAQAARGARRSGVGRKPFLPADEEQVLVVLEGLCLKWGRWTAEARAGKRLPKRLRPAVMDADAAVATVRRLAAGLLKRPEPTPTARLP